MKNQKRQYNTLTFQQRLKLIDFLRSTTYEDGTLVKQIAEEAVPVVGFYVTEHNVRSTAEAAGIDLPSWKAPKVDLLQDIRELRAAIEELSRRLTTVEIRLCIPSSTEHSND